MKPPLDESYRDSIFTVDQDGKRRRIFPKRVQGYWAHRRRWVAYLLMFVLLALPWLRLKGLPVVQVDVMGRRFVLLGQVFWPQDFYLLAIGLILGMLTIAWLTTVYGRVFCGWVCPQTIFMEHLFREVEYLIEGDRSAQIRRAQLPIWHADRWPRWLFKNVVFWILSLVVANTFWMYFLGSDAWLNKVISGPAAQPVHFGGMLAFTTVFFGVFSWFREQVCLIVCPYGRMQGVLLDQSSMVIAYDSWRGETRGKMVRGEDRSISGKGDCVDCNLCVQVCPTGIDIRNGTQLECINCTACIDACDDVMIHRGLPKGLIRYASLQELKDRLQAPWTLRNKVYAGLVILLSLLWIALIALRSPMEANVRRAPGQTYHVSNGRIRNLYTVQIINKNPGSAIASIHIIRPADAQLVWIADSVWTLPSKGQIRTSFFVEMPLHQGRGSRRSVDLDLKQDGRSIQRVRTNFYGPP